MKGWKCVPLGDAPIEIIDGDRGKNYPSEGELLANGYCLFLSTKNVREHGFDFSSCQFITNEKDNLLRKGKLQINDVVLTTRGTVGNIALYDSNVKYNNVRINSGMVIIRPIIEKVDPKYIFYAFKLLQKEWPLVISGSAQPQLPIKDIKNVEISIPKIDEQRAIASVLSSLDDKIDLLQRQNATLEAMAEALFKQWFTITSNLNNNYTLGELFNITSGKGIKKEDFLPNGIYPILGANGKIGGINKFLYDEKLIYTGRVGTLGKIFISEGKVWLSDNTLVFTNIKYFYSVYFILKSLGIDDYNVGSTQPLIRQTDIKNIEICLPDHSLIEKFENFSLKIFNKVKLNEFQINTLEKIRDTLLPKLMSGEVRVKY